MQRRRKGVVFLAVVCMILVGLQQIPVQAVEVTGIDQTAVYIRQGKKGTCTLCSAVMMLRRAALYDGSENWDKIRVSDVSKKAWTQAGLQWNFTYGGYSVTHDSLPGGSANTLSLRKLLNQHPEGVVLYDKSVPHAVLLTDFENGQFYCMDPAPNVEKGKIPLNQAYRVSVSKASAVWYVKRQNFTIDNIRYQVLDAPGTKNEVQVTGLVKTNVKEVRIPDRVMYNRVKYKVTRIAEYAFEDNRQIEKVVLGKYVKSISEGAFSGASALNQVDINPSVVRDIGMGAFEPVLS